MMYMIERNVAVRLVMMVAIVMQFVALTPHHHHNGQETPCFNILHCPASGCDAAAARHRCGDGSDSEPTEQADCSLSSLVVVQPVRDDSECYCHTHHHALSHLDLLVADLFFTDPADALPGLYPADTPVETPCLQYTPARYVAETGSLRAPPFMV
ncbi:MAG: hypothetical protein IJC16_05180 [Rikenellaceae bacterium]|nr:hypothetical protein [Rikenellaceae bacterium]